MFYLAFDDTDSRKGMCTTFLSLWLLSELEGERGWRPVGNPCLVRLNPNVPWKTRGNGAVCLGVKGGEGERSEDLDQLFETLKVLVSAEAQLEEDGTDPGFGVFSQPPPISCYHKALHELTTVEEMLGEFQGSGVEVGSYRLGGLKKKRGIIGALAAAAWHGNTLPSTYELIAYRRRENWGTKRRVRPEGAAQLDERFPSTFNNYDPVNRYAAVFPSSPCPVLYGLRGLEVEQLRGASDFLESFVDEPVAGRLVFQTNQGTDAHIQQVKMAAVRPYGSYRVRGVVCGGVSEIRGGHVFVDIRDGENTLTCAAFEPTKEFRHVVRQLEDGDKVEAWGGVKENSKALNLEKLEVLELAEKPVKLANPRCENCQRSMKSVGKGAGYRCPGCGKKAPEEAAEFGVKERGLEKGLYEVPVIARRHLARPLSLMERLSH